MTAKCCVKQDGDRHVTIKSRENGDESFEEERGESKDCEEEY